MLKSYQQCFEKDKFFNLTLFLRLIDSASLLFG
jgi:hypothetical protein